MIEKEDMVPEVPVMSKYVTKKKARVCAGLRGNPTRNQNTDMNSFRHLMIYNSRKGSISQSGITQS